ncbi:MAG: tetratricopeptide repeat protein [Myxococcales bacterium]|nr:tetratricopeptide repeat protein [Myxococcales bacterium]
MDVTCERCGTEYEFDETLVSERGTTVKCTNCGHLFKVFRDAAAAPRPWTVRKADGISVTLTSLRDLQRLIASGDLTRDDLISRSGEGWKRLGDIAELSTFFAAAEARSTAPSIPTRDRTPPALVPPPASTAATSEPTAHGSRPIRPHAPTAPMPGPPIPPPTPTSARDPLTPPPMAPPPAPSQTVTAAIATVEPPPTRTKGTLLGVGATSTPQPVPPPPTVAPPSVKTAPLPAVQGPSTASRAVPPAPVARQATPTVPQAPPHRPIAPTRASFDVEHDLPPRPAPSMRASVRPAASATPVHGPALTLDDDDASAPRPSRGRSGLRWALALVLLFGLGAGVALAWPTLAPRFGLAPAADPVQPFLERAQAALALDTEEGYAEAIREYTRATAIAERDVRVMIGLSRAHAAFAQALAFRASDLEIAAAAQPALAGEAAALRREAREHAVQARSAAEAAARAAPNDASALVALADAQRLNGDLDGARSSLQRARSLDLEPHTAALVAYVEGLLAGSAPTASPGAGRDELAVSVTRDPSLVRARLALARALLARGEVADARTQLDEILRRIPAHTAARSLRDAIDRGLPPAPARLAVVADAGARLGPDPAPDPAPVPAVVAEAPASERASPPVREPSRATESRDSPRAGGPPTARDYGWYVRAGNEAMARGDLGLARAMYEAALGTRPSGSEALTGLGQVLLEQGQAASAIGYLRQAAQLGFADAFIALGDAYLRQGQTQQAVQAYQGYLERLPSGPRAALARAHIERLRGAPTQPSQQPPSSSTEGPSSPTPPPSSDPRELPAPRGVDPNTLPRSDSLAIGNES